MSNLILPNATQVDVDLRAFMATYIEEIRRRSEREFDNRAALVNYLKSKGENKYVLLSQPVNRRTVYDIGSLGELKKGDAIKMMGEFKLIIEVLGDDKWLCLSPLTQKWLKRMLRGALPHDIHETLAGVYGFNLQTLPAQLRDTIDKVCVSYRVSFSKSAA